MTSAKTHQTIVNVRYAALQGAYWMSYCVMVGYAAAYLVCQEFSNSGIGAVLAASSALAVLVQTLAASISDSGRKNAVANLAVIFLCAIIVLSGALYPATGRHFLTAALMLAGPALLMAVQPLLTSICFLEQRKGISINFGLSRGIGSLSYAAMSVIAGNLMQAFGFSLFPALCAGTLAGTLLLVISFRTARSGDQDRGDQDRGDQDRGDQDRSAESNRAGEEKGADGQTAADSGIIGFARANPAFAFFCVGVFLVFFDHALIGNFLIQIVRNVGGNVADMGNCLSLSAVVELPAMTLFWVFRKKIRCATALKFAGVMFFVKHTITLCAHSMATLYLAQFFQVGAFALFLPAATYYANESLSSANMVKGQSFILGAITMSGVFASLIGGIALERLGIFATLLIGLTVSLAGAVSLFLALKSPRRGAEK